MDLEFSIVLFENEGYATAGGDKGVQDILASSADAGYIKDGTYPLFLDCIHIVGNGGSARSRRK